MKSRVIAWVMAIPSFFGIGYEIIARFGRPLKISIWIYLCLWAAGLVGYVSQRILLKRYPKDISRWCTFPTLLWVVWGGFGLLGAAVFMYGFRHGID